MKKYKLISLIGFTAAVICFTTTAAVNGRNSAKEEYLYAANINNTSDKNYGVYGGMMENLAEKYPDICGWINVEKTKICYPLLITNDNEYYVRKAYDGTYDKNGSIIVDYRLNRDLTENRNIILYGHNMASGNMFAYLANPEKFINAEIEIYSNGKLAIYKPYSAYIEGRNEFVKTVFHSDEELNAYVEAGISKSKIDFGVTPGEAPYLLTMITCESNFGLGDKRIVIHAVLTELISP